MTCPRLSINLINKHLPKSLATVKGHLDQELKNLQSAKDNSIDEDIEPPQDQGNIRIRDFLCYIQLQRTCIQELLGPNRTLSNQVVEGKSLYMHTLPLQYQYNTCSAHQEQTQRKYHTSMEGYVPIIEETRGSPKNQYPR